MFIREMFLAGVSARRVGEVIAPILGEALGPQTVSRVAHRLDAEVSRFHRRPLNNGY
jgi:transposase-like protein